jgi:cellulose synthase/poly-beta-1,6-N-acetylglucosamine synthase-like glycosyltransferase
MPSFLDALLTAAWLVLLLPIGTLFVEMLAAARVRSHAPAGGGLVRPRLAVLVPAHDEAKMIAVCLHSIQAELLPGERLLVVADNCLDDTAALAAAAGATVIIRHDMDRRGKGFALQYGLDYLAAEKPPEVLVILDADCMVTSGSIAALAALAAASGRPVQGRYLLTCDTTSTAKARIGAFAVLVKNYLRPLGGLALDMPCPLTGSGMAFPWPLLHSVHQGTADIVEDMVLGQNLTLAGTPPQFCPEAVITSPLPTSTSGLMNQRKRWERGHLDMIQRFAPALLRAAMVRRDRRLALAVLDLAVPPLALLSLGFVILGGLTVGWTVLAGHYLPASLLFVAAVLFGHAIATAWRLGGHEIISIRELIYIPFYVIQKFPIYIGLLRGDKIRWARSDRN